MNMLLKSGLGYLGNQFSHKLTFLGLACELGINTELDLRWFAEDAFIGATENGKAFVELFNEQAAKVAVVAAADALIAAAPHVEPGGNTTTKSYGYFGGFDRRVCPSEAYRGIDRRQAS